MTWNENKRWLFLGKEILLPFNNFRIYGFEAREALNLYLRETFKILGLGTLY